MPSKTSSANSTGSKSNDQGHPEDIIPMVLTSATQELFGCRADEDVTAENPYKLLKKDDIIEDMKAKAAVSDFSPVKQIILDYPESELLLVFDRDFTYGQCFYLVTTPEAKEKILNPPESEPEEDSVNDIIKTPEPKEWVSLGSEKEIDEESLRETRVKLLYKFSRARKEFGMPVSFSDRNVADAKDGNLECVSFADRRFNIKLMQRDCAVQAIPDIQSSSAQTQWKYMKNSCTQYTPGELNEKEKEKTLDPKSINDFCNTVANRVLHALQQEDIMNVFKDDWMALGTDHEDFEWTGKLSDVLMLYQAFTDNKYTQDKGISCMHWHPTIHGVIAVTLAEKKKQQWTMSKGPLIGFYSFSDPTHIKILLECPDDILTFEFCPSDPNIIVGGCSNGQIVLWEISAYVACLMPVTHGAKHESVKTGVLDLEDNKENKVPIVRYSAMSGVENSHTGPITDVHWLPQTFEVTAQGMPVENKYNISVQLITCSPDGSFMFWDIRMPKQLRQTASDKKQSDSEPQMANYSDNNPFKHLDKTWKPLFKVSLVHMERGGEYAPLRFSLDYYTSNNTTIPEIAEDPGEIPDYSQLQVPSGKGLAALEDVNTKIYIGTRDGEIVYTDWKLEKNDLDQLIHPKPLCSFRIHPCLVNTIDRSPFFKDIVLTGTSLYGSCNIAIWKEGVLDGPLFLMPTLEGHCTVACWSLTRPAVFFVGKGDGKIEVWNLLEKTGEAVHVQEHMTNGKITCIKPWTVSSKQHFLALADDVGIVRVFQIPPVYYIAPRNERVNMGKCIQQQQERLNDLLRRRELWQNQPAPAGKKVATEKPGSPTEEEPDEMKEYDDFLVLEENVLQGMGLTP
ncbi:dynein axonemal intermediate chain 3 isoform X1 [Entelurus aequoreus]|uniref:dynein axonemal intermediate chain 3 isoform X1 n=1 Tax=Entelurus aequoreus TaxID=161455 RepID=UPI002B1E6AF9|nr:dynein axonemal intermediate chain 3 isoform X1 [Entelurus aequoreus]XP_061884165.1 dynein axonemal intermediate chain 3 isoform X1 [Entelurus aequoreus]XP_061884166.1 dynein axonemal intermediate chain 3 isoform X1 [Entelurus aequoreus]XP_061884167.1 dynein axonemal intermediate chain 3 isoform X1 [Entelurus aequoreus]